MGSCETLHQKREACVDKFEPAKVLTSFLFTQRVFDVLICCEVGSDMVEVHPFWQSDVDYGIYVAGRHLLFQTL